MKSDETYYTIGIILLKSDKLLGSLSAEIESRDKAVELWNRLVKIISEIKESEE